LRSSVVPTISKNVTVSKNVSWDANSGKPYEVNSNDWTLVGQSGFDKIENIGASSYSLMTQSSAFSAGPGAGSLTGEYRGYLRSEPGITTDTTLDLSFRIRSIDVNSAGLDNLALGVHIGDGSSVTSLCFLQDALLPKFSYSGFRLPDEYGWKKYGNQAAHIEDRILRLVDTSANDFIYYDIVQEAGVGTYLRYDKNWVVDFTFKVNSFSPSTAQYYQGYQYCGSTFSVNEGKDGINLEAHLAINNTGTYLVITSFDNATKEFIVNPAFIAFEWNDDAFHSITFKNNPGSTISLMIDGRFINSTARSIFKYGGTVNSILAFGTGALSTYQINTSASRSDVIFGSVSAYEDKPNTSKYVGVYTGGDKSKLSSYVVYPHDWSGDYKYRILKEPSNGVSVFIGDKKSPVIAVDSSTNTLIQSHLNFLYDLVPTKRFVAFGSFNDGEFVRSSWLNVNYSIRRLSEKNNLIPTGSVLNRRHGVASYEHHLSSETPRHRHFGFTVSSEGTPENTYYAGTPNVNGIPQGLLLAEDTPSFAESQTVQQSGGMLREITSLSNLSTSESENIGGYYNKFVKDTDSTLNSLSSLASTSAYTAIRDRYILMSSFLNRHTALATSHVIPTNSALVDEMPTQDTVENNILLLNRCVDMFGAYINHISKRDLHCQIITEDKNPVITLKNPISILNDLLTRFQTHLTSDGIHNNSVLIRMRSPENALYEQVTVFNHEEGVKGLISSALDEDIGYTLVP
jgi:hypothetical protein